MKKTSIGAALLALAHLANAQFVDERTQRAAPRATAATQLGTSSPVPITPSAPPPPKYQLGTGQPISAGLSAWAEREGWMLMWYPQTTWKTVREATIEATDAPAAVSEVIDILRDEGKSVALRVSAGNKVMEVMSTEVRND